MSDVNKIKNEAESTNDAGEDDIQEFFFHGPNAIWNIIRRQGMSERFYVTILERPLGVPTNCSALTIGGYMNGVTKKMHLKYVSKSLDSDFVSNV